MSNLAQRLLTAAVGLPLLIGALWLGAPWLTALVLAAALLAAWEFGRIATATGGPVNAPLLYAGAALFVLDAAAGGQRFPMLLAALLLLSMAGSAVRYREGAPALGWLWTVGGALYAGWLVSHFLLLREVPMGREWVLFALVIAVTNDTGAYVVGRLFGKHRLAPAVSPGKTVEGAVGGVVATAAIAPLAAALLMLPGAAALALLAALGAVLAVAGQMGDLAESMLKRAAGIKDTSALLPGHGGILDRMDSLVFIAPLVYYYVQWIIMAQ